MSTFETPEVKMTKTGAGWQASTLIPMRGFCCDWRPLVFVTAMCPTHKTVVTKVTIGSPSHFGLAGTASDVSNPTPHFYEEYQYPATRTKLQLERYHRETIRHQPGSLLRRIYEFYASKGRDYDIKILVHDAMASVMFLVDTPWEQGTPQAEVLLQGILHRSHGSCDVCEPPFLFLNHKGNFLVKNPSSLEELVRRALDHAGICYTEEVLIGDWKRYIRRLRKLLPNEYEAMFVALVQREKAKREQQKLYC